LPGFPSLPLATADAPKNGSIPAGEPGRYWRDVWFFAAMIGLKNNKKEYLINAARRHNGTFNQ
jgi:hypothetical protein